MIKVSVIIPVYNVEAYLRKCLDSIVNQTMSDLEIICVDDGSTDESPAILSEYSAKDSRVKIITREHTNAGAARNAGMAVANGEYVGFVDADDFCDLSLFEKAYREGVRTDSDIVQFRFKQYNTKTSRFEAEHYFPGNQLAIPRPFSPDALGDSLLAPIILAPWARIVRRRLIEKENLQFQSIERTNDVLFCCLALATATRISIVDEALYFYRKEHGGNLQSGNDKTPMLVFKTWRAVADGLAERNLLKPLWKSFVSASTNSFFYILGTMNGYQNAKLFYDELHRLYDKDELYSSATHEDVAFAKPRMYFNLMKECDSFAEFLLRQNDYHKNRATGETLAHQTSDRKVTELQKREKALNQETAELKKRENSLNQQIAELKKRETTLNKKIADLSRAISDKDAKIAELAGSRSYKIGRIMTWPVRILRSLRQKRARS